MERIDNDVDLLLAEARESIVEPEDQSSYKKGKTAKKSAIRIILGVLGKFLCVLLETVLLAAVALYGVMFVLAKGPSPTARDIFVLSVRETSAVGFLANLFFTDEEIAQIEAGGNTIEFEDIDTSLIVIPKPTQPDDPQQGPKPDEWGLIDEDGDGIIIDSVKGEGFSGYMMVVLDPSRVIMASKPEAFGHRGYTVAQMVEEFDAIAGINAGGFYDPNGQGNGSIPDTMVIYDGQIYYPEFGSAAGFVGIDNNHIIHVGRFTASQAKDKNIQYGVGFGPVLIANGEAIPNAASGVNPRTGIGQRSDGAILMLVIDGRQVTSLGATYQDMTEIFFSYGAVNACNLDGGSSSMMWYQGGYINNCASVVGIRPVPTTFLVLKEGVGSNG
mgnify:CR=1 FL=1